MSEIIKTIQTQISNCKKLLSIFQGERQTYRENNHIATQEVLDILKQKQALVDAVEQQRELMNSLRDSSEALSDDEKNIRRNMMSELASLFEQLLVIDRENEKLLRDLLSTKDQPQSISRGSGNNINQPRQRSFLQKQLPLIPGMHNNNFQAQVSREEEQAERIQRAKAAAASKNSMSGAMKKLILGSNPEADNNESKKQNPTLADILSTTNAAQDQDSFKYKPKSCLREYSGAGQFMKMARYA